MTPMTTLPEAAVDGRTAVIDALPRVSYRDRRHGVAAERPAPGRYLEVDDGAERLLLPLRHGTTHVGRSFTADVVLDDMSVSRRHAIVHQRASGVRILDDRSANGTFVNGRRVNEADLRDGDVVVLGRVVVTYRDVAV
ncbi:MAG TPA: FHA domain-containing protein [Baekduia sp.]|uniref:FHA domain-containing protein n=1 Tax=Baekduia sp. TaxID=2600305 RepID=UPI002D79A64D|nr:FHA domain-containing protein [Baekduia sp.]HET6509613.1 FHA domain-containing protein [Baekduia sp.]